MLWLLYSWDCKMRNLNWLDRTMSIRHGGMYSLCSSMHLNLNIEHQYISKSRLQNVLIKVILNSTYEVYILKCFLCVDCKMFFRDFFRVMLWSNPIFYFLKYCETLEPPALFQQGVKVRCRKKGLQWLCITLPHHPSTNSVIAQIFLDSVAASVEPYSSCSQTFPFLEACLSLSSNHKCPQNRNPVFLQEISPRQTRDFTGMSLLFFHSHLRTHGITKSVTKAFNTGMPKLQIKRMSQHAIKHILITHKKPKRIERTHFLVCLKFRQLAWWQSAVLSLSNVTSHHLFLHYFRFEVPSALPVLSQFKKTFLPCCGNT